MNNELDKLKKEWEAAKNKLAPTPVSVDQLVELAKEKKKSSVYFHYGNIIILTIVVGVIIFFFYYLFPLEDLLSKWGVGLMVGGLAVRILVEFFSVAKSKKINISETALQTTNDTIDFFHFRKMIHGPVTVGIVLAYAIGFYMLTPEFARHFGWKSILFWDIMSVFIAVFLIWQIRKGIRKEMKELSEIVELKNELEKEENPNPV